jgi:hypothetical protein
VVVWGTPALFLFVTVQVTGTFRNAGLLVAKSLDNRSNGDTMMIVHD